MLLAVVMLLFLKLCQVAMAIEEVRKHLLMKMVEVEEEVMLVDLVVSKMPAVVEEALVS